MAKRKSIITKIDGKPLVDPRKSITHQLKKLSKPRKKKVWVTFQCDVELRNEASKACIMLNLNMSKYLRRKLVDLITAAKTGKIPKPETEFVEIPKATIDTTLNKQV